MERKIAKSKRPANVLELLKKTSKKSLHDVTVEVDSVFNPTLGIGPVTERLRLAQYRRMVFGTKPDLNEDSFAQQNLESFAAIAANRATSSSGW